MQIQPFQLERFFSKYEFNAPYLLCSSDCESMTVQDLLNLEPNSLEGLTQTWLGYTEYPGHPALRREIARLYETIQPEQIMVHAGAEEAIFNFMNAVLTASDHVIVQFPCYQSLGEIANAIGCEVTRWEMSEADNWELDLDFLKDNIRPNTRAIVFNCPHNPTGYLMSKEKLQAIVDIARKRKIYIFSDEVYRLSEYNPADRLPAACDAYEHAISLGVMSKSFGLAGLRIGWIATRDSDVYQKMGLYKDYTSICNSAPSEYLAILALRHKEAILQRNLEIIRTNLTLLTPFFKTHEALFNWQPPKAGTIAFPGIRFDGDVEDFCIDLVEKQGVLLLPGNYYDYGHKNFRLGFGRKNLPQALERLEMYISDHLSV